MPGLCSDLSRISVMNDPRSQQERELVLRKAETIPNSQLLGVCLSRGHDGSCHMAMAMSLLRTLEKDIQSHNS